MHNGWTIRDTPGFKRVETFQTNSRAVSRQDSAPLARTFMQRKLYRLRGTSLKGSEKENGGCGVEIMGESSIII